MSAVDLAPGTAGLPGWCRLVRADNPGPMTLDGTNSYLLACRDGVVVVDPGPLLDAHLERLASYAPVVRIMLTHSHPDHAEGARRFAALTGAAVQARDPLWCVGADPFTLDDGDLGLPGLAGRVVFTPGHTSDSVCFVVHGPGGRGDAGGPGDAGEPSSAGEPSGAVLTGDTVLGRGTTVVAHPDGRLGPYLASLDRLRRLGRRLTLLPGHGPVRPDLAAVVDEYQAHRAQRLDEVRAAVAGGARTAREVVEVVYADVDRALWPAAELSVRAQLEHLGLPTG